MLGCSFCRVLLHHLKDFASLPEFAHLRESKKRIGSRQLSRAEDLHKKHEFARTVYLNSVNYLERPLVRYCETINTWEIIGGVKGKETFHRIENVCVDFADKFGRTSRERR